MSNYKYPLRINGGSVMSCHGTWIYKDIALESLSKEVHEMESLLKELAEDACEKCKEKDCADCWAMDYQPEIKSKGETQ